MSSNAPSGMTSMGMDTHPPRTLAESAVSVPAGDEAAFGLFLRHARERRGLSLLQVSRETKIPERHLEALERGDLAAVPRGLYQRGAIRAFASSVGLDPEVAIAELARATGTDRAAQETPAPRPAHRRRRTPALAALGIALGLTAAVSALALWPRGRTPEGDGPGVHDVAPPASRMDGPSAVPAAASSPPAETGTALALDAEPPAPVPPPIVDGTLTITSEPAGARVTVNGVGWGVTPIVVPHLALGGQRIRVTRDGYRAAERDVNLDQDRPARTLHLVLEPRP